MTMDQIYARLCDKNILKQDIGSRTKVLSSDAALSRSETGELTAVTASGEKVKLKPSGMSKAKMIKMGLLKGEKE